MVLFSCFYSKAILKISQIKGLRDPECGYASEPFGFTKAVADEVQERVDSNPEATEGGDA